MKKIFAVAALALFAACNSNNEPAKVDSMKSPSDSTTAQTMRDVNSPYQIMYSSKFEIADPKYAEAVLGLWKDWDNGDLMNSKNSFADTLNFYFADGTMIHASRDSALAIAQAARNKIATSVSRVDAVIAVKSTDKDENWALIWGSEKDTDKKGNMDSTQLQETWRFNKDGKLDQVFQYRMAHKPAKKK